MPPDLHPALSRPSSSTAAGTGHGPRSGSTESDAVSGCSSERHWHTRYIRSCASSDSRFRSAAPGDDSGEVVHRSPGLRPRTQIAIHIAQPSCPYLLCSFCSSLLCCWSTARSSHLLTCSCSTHAEAFPALIRLQKPHHTLSFQAIPHLTEARTSGPACVSPHDDVLSSSSRNPTNERSPSPPS